MRFQAVKDPQLGASGASMKSSFCKELGTDFWCRLMANRKSGFQYEVVRLSD